MDIPALQSPIPSGLPLSWPGRLDLAASESEVIEVARDYLASLDPFEVDRLPDPCKPRKLFVANDIAAYALDLVRSDCDPDSAAVVHRVAGFFANANDRLVHLLADTRDLGTGRKESA